MRTGLTLGIVLLTLGGCGSADEAGLPDDPDDNDTDTAREPAEVVASYDAMPGFIGMYWDAGGGRLLLEVSSVGEPFLYQSSLARGVGSNDLGLDRGELGATRIVQFERSGPKLLLVESNVRYRALDAAADERRAVDESFARSVLWGFDSLGEHDGALLIDATDFFLRDAHGIGERLEEDGEGSYVTDASSSAIYLPRTRNFPDNSEIEAIVTFTGKATGAYLPTVVPDPGRLTVHLHHSFIRLPDEGYEPLPYDPRAGVIGLRYNEGGFLDYASAVGDPLVVGYARRHRLEKKDPAADVSAPVEPIVYYVDRGVPEPVRSALIDGASWWNEAFEAAGYRDAFRVEMLPEDADPMDVRYNVIQWVHRATRGWSYGSSILDPRTGEIMKGLVTLGSLRIRQDYMIAEGLLAPYEGDALPAEMLEMSLARIRQLSAHEVGHTLGLEHNFAASTRGRNSVMDYPHPLVRLDEEGNVDLSAAYDTGIGEWDKRVVLYAYQDYPDDVDAPARRRELLEDTIESGMTYVADQDSRAVGSAHPDGNLWDNGGDALQELDNLLRVREVALERFSERNLRVGRPLATLEEVLVPVYLLHRYQLHAVGKLVGGSYYGYNLRGDGQPLPRPVEPGRQRAAIEALLATLAPEILYVPDSVTRLLPPRPPGYPRTRETFPSATGVTFDPLGAADSAAALTLEVLLDPERAARMNAQRSQLAAAPGFADLLDSLLRATWYAPRLGGTDGAIQRRVADQVLSRLMQLSVQETAADDVRSLAYNAVLDIDRWLDERATPQEVPEWRGHFRRASLRIRQMQQDPSSVEAIELPEPPPGSPIGMP